MACRAVAVRPASSVSRPYSRSRFSRRIEEMSTWRRSPRAMSGRSFCNSPVEPPSSVTQTTELTRGNSSFRPVKGRCPQSGRRESPPTMFDRPVPPPNTTTRVVLVSRAATCFFRSANSAAMAGAKEVAVLSRTMAVIFSARLFSASTSSTEKPPAVRRFSCSVRGCCAAIQALYWYGKGKGDVPPRRVVSGRRASAPPGPGRPGCPPRSSRVR